MPVGGERYQMVAVFCGPKVIKLPLAPLIVRVVEIVCGEASEAALK